MQVCLVSALTQAAAPLPVEGVADFDDAPLGVLTLAAILEREQIPVTFFDLDWEFSRHQQQGNAADDFRASIAQRLADIGASTFGFSTMCNSWPLTLWLSKRLKELRPDVRIILGGPQATAVDAPALDLFPHIDFIVRGEADESFPRLLSCLDEGGKFLELIPGISFRRADQVYRNCDPAAFFGLDDDPLPAYHLYGIRRAKIMALELGRGCPFACAFCSTNNFFRRRFRLVSPQVMVGRMKEMNTQYGVRDFSLVHDMFTVDRRAVVAFCEAMIRSGTGYRWSCSARTDCVDSQLLKLMAEANCSGIFFGIETGSGKLQKIIQKNLDPVEALANVRSASAAGLGTTVSLITGFPEEDPADFRQTISFLLDAALGDSVRTQLHLLAPLSGTPIERANRSNLRLDSISSDISTPFNLAPEERQWVGMYPEIFSSFYHVPTPHLDRDYVARAGIFVLDGLRSLRWLMIALHQVSGHLLDVFDRWRLWQSSALPPTVDLTSFLLFTEAEYGTHAAIGAFVELYRLIDTWTSGASRATKEDRTNRGSTPVLTNETVLLQLSFSLRTLLGHLRSGTLSKFEPGRPCSVAIASGRGGQRVIDLHPLEASLLSFCNGQRNLSSIVELADWSSWVYEIVVSREDAGYIVLNELAKEGLLEWSGAKSPKASSRIAAVAVGSHAGGFGKRPYKRASISTSRLNQDRSHRR